MKRPTEEEVARYTALSAGLRAIGEPGFTLADIQRAKARQPIAIAALVLLGGVSFLLPELAEPWREFAWLGLASAMLFAAFNLKQVRAIFTGRRRSGNGSLPPLLPPENSTNY